jgi:hypothetical protein
MDDILFLQGIVSFYSDIHYMLSHAGRLDLVGYLLGSSRKAILLPYSLQKGMIVSKLEVCPQRARINCHFNGHDPFS